MILNVEIRVKGRIDQQWSEWFEGLQIAYLQADQTVLSGPLVDQAALYGLLARLWSLRLPLVSVRVVEAEDSI